MIHDPKAMERTCLGYLPNDGVKLEKLKQIIFVP